MPRISSKWADYGRASFRMRQAQQEEQRARFALDNAATEDQAAAAAEALGAAIADLDMHRLAIDSLSRQLAE